MLNYIMLNVVILSIILLNVAIPSVINLSVMLSIVAPFPLPLLFAERSLVAMDTL